jgi:hypothetical protein
MIFNLRNSSFNNFHNCDKNDWIDNILNFLTENKYSLNLGNLKISFYITTLNFKDLWIKY